jgi:beta-N-acetylhexosaminidase
MKPSPTLPKQERKPRRAARRWLARLALLLILGMLAARAGLASAGFMLPGGAIIGWSQITQTNCVLCHAPKSVTNPAGHLLTPADYAALLTQRLTLDEALGQMMIGQFAGQNATPEAIEMLNAESLGGVTLYAANIGSASQTRAMDKQLQQIAAIPPLIAVDQEGGTVNRLFNLVGPLPAAADLTTPQMARTRGSLDAGLLHNLGINLNLAPVVDVGTSNPQLYGRTFGSDPNRVAALAGAYLEGLQASEQVTGCLKHFPGLGDTTTDPHLGMPVLNRSRADLEQIDMKPYRLLLKSEDVRAVMVSHEMIPAVDTRLPTSLSPATINGLLRDELGYQGVVITDSLYMDAISARWSVPDAGVLAIEAGTDIISGLYDPQVVQQTKDAIKDAIASGKLTRQRIDASVQRILTLKVRMGLIPMPQQPSARQPTPTPRGSTPTNLLQMGWVRQWE